MAIVILDIGTTDISGELQPQVISQVLKYTPFKLFKISMNF